MVVDNTNVTPAERAAVIAIAREFVARVVGYYIEASDARSGGAERAPRRPREGARRSRSSPAPSGWMPPAPGEGFDEIHTVRATDDGRFA